MEGFQVTEIGEKIYCILDAGNSSFYVVEGEEKAAVIDTGITAGTKILPVIRELTDKPLLLVITHAHPDHMYHMDEFDEVYMCHDEKKMDPETLVMLTAGKLKPWEEIHDIRTDSVLETKQNYLFTGDAIGSGCGVWMQVPGGTSLEEYYDGLVGLMVWLVKRGGRMKFFGGHHTQVFESTAHPVYNPLSLGVLADLIDLVDQVIHGENLGRPSNAKPFSKEQVRYASYGRAEMQYCASRIHRK